MYRCTALPAHASVCLTGIAVGQICFECIPQEFVCVGSLVVRVAVLGEGVELLRDVTQWEIPK